LQHRRVKTVTQTCLVLCFKHQLHFHKVSVSHCNIAIDTKSGVWRNDVSTTYNIFKHVYNGVHAPMYARPD